MLKMDCLIVGALCIYQVRISWPVDTWINLFTRVNIYIKKKNALKEVLPDVAKVIID